MVFRSGVRAEPNSPPPWPFLRWAQAALTPVVDVTSWSRLPWVVSLLPHFFSFLLLFFCTVPLAALSPCSLFAIPSPLSPLPAHTSPPSPPSPPPPLSLSLSLSLSSLSLFVSLFFSLPLCFFKCRS